MSIYIFVRKWHRFKAIQPKYLVLFLCVVNWYQCGGNYKNYCWRIVFWFWLHWRECLSTFEIHPLTWSMAYCALSRPCLEVSSRKLSRGLGSKSSLSCVAWLIFQSIVCSLIVIILVKIFCWGPFLDMSQMFRVKSAYTYAHALY